jgi:hypothetical protein
MPFIAQDHEIEYWVDESGTLHAEVQGWEGKGCDVVAQILKDIVVVESEEHTDDYDKPEPQGRTVRGRTSRSVGSY